MKKKKLLILFFIGSLLMTGCINNDNSCSSQKITEKASALENNEAENNPTETKTDADSKDNTNINGTDSNIIIQYENTGTTYTYDEDNDIEILSASLSLPTVKIPNHEASSQKINDFFAKEKKDFDDLCEKLIIESKELYDERLSWQEEEGNLGEFFYAPYGEDLTFRNYRVDDNLITFLREDYSYYSGAHGSYLLVGLNFDTKTGDLLEISDLSDHPEELKGFLKEEIIAQAKENPDSPDAYFYDPDSAEFSEAIDSVINGNYFYFNNFGLNFIANDYVIAPYAAGFFEFTIPYQKLTGIIKDSYLNTGAYMAAYPNGASALETLDANVGKIPVSCINNYNATEDTYHPEIMIDDMVYSYEMIQDIMDRPFEIFSGIDYFYVLDLDSSDEYKELAICDWGLNDYHMTYLFRYVDGKLISLGSLPGLVSESNFRPKGNGTIVSSSRLPYLESFQTITEFTLNSNGQMEEVKKDWYIPYKEYYLDSKHEILQDVIVYKEADTNSEEITLHPEDGPVCFPEIGADGYVKIQLKDNTIYYMHMSGFSTIDQNGTDLDEQEVFSNMYLAG